MTRVTVLGSGTALPTAERASPGIFVEPRGAGAMLLDPGPGTLCRLAGKGGTVEAVKAVWITHFHPDHTLDLMALLFARRNPWLRPRLDPLRIVGPRGTAALLARMENLYGAWIRPEKDRVSVIEVEPGPLPSEAGLPGAAFPMEHGVPALGYRFHLADGVLAFSGDTGPCEAAVELGKGADLFFIECAIPQEYPDVPGHLKPRDAARIAAGAGAGKVVLYHLYPPVDADAARETVKNAVAGEVVVAGDGDRFSL